MTLLAQFLVIAGVLAVLAGAPAVQGEVKETSGHTMRVQHQLWMSSHGRQYSNASEMEARYEVFKENVEHIRTFNRAPNKPYKLAINHLADLTEEEFVKSRLGLMPPSSLDVEMVQPNDQYSFMYENAGQVPSTMDWRLKGAVSPVKDQGQCGMFKALIC